MKSKIGGYGECSLRRVITFVSRLSIRYGGTSCPSHQEVIHINGKHNPVSQFSRDSPIQRKPIQYRIGEATLAHVMVRISRYCRFLVLSSHIGALGLNLQTANYVCFYESPVSPIVRRQAEARVYRTGQKRTTFVYDLYIQGTVEERILQFLKEGKNLYDQLMTKPKLAQL